MVRATIQRLSDDILLVVFDFLDAKSLKNASLVCFNWSELIGSSTTTMKKFKLILSNRSLPSQNDKLKWKHQNVDIRYGLDQLSINEYFNKLLENFADKFDISMAKNLIFISITKIDASLIMRLVSQCPNLISLQMIFIRDFNVCEDTTMKFVFLPKLKTLDIRWHRKRNVFLKFIKADQISELTFEKTSMNKDISEIPPFVKSLTKLKKLRMSAYALDRMIGSLSEFEFQLTSLELGNKEIATSVMANLNNLLISQSSSLTELKFRSSLCQNETLTTIFRLKRLLKLSINAGYLGPDNSTDTSNLSSLEPMNALKELKLQLRTDINYYEKIIIEKCPNLKRLDINCRHIATFAQHIFELCPELEALSINAVQGSIYYEKYFTHLKHLTVDTIANIVPLLILIESSPSLESLVVQKFSFSELRLLGYVFADFLEKPTLSHVVLRIKNAPEAEDIFRNKSYMNSHGKLKTMQLNFDNIEDILMFELSLNWSKWCIERQLITKIQVLKNHRREKLTSYIDLGSIYDEFGHSVLNRFSFSLH